MKIGESPRPPLVSTVPAHVRVVFLFKSTCIENVKTLALKENNYVELTPSLQKN